MVTVCVFAVAMAMGAVSATAVPRVYTVAGNGHYGFSGDGGPATEAAIRPDCVAALRDGSILIGSGGRIRRVGRDGRIVTVAGTGRSGFSGDGKSAKQARIAGCSYEDDLGDLAALPDGGFVMADGENGVLRRVWPDGVITTVAGYRSGDEEEFQGDVGDGGPATRAYLPAPSGLSVLPDGGLALATASGDEGYSLIRRIWPDGHVTTVAGVAGACGRAKGQEATDVLLRPLQIVPAPAGGFLLVNADEPAPCVVLVAADGRVTMPPQPFPFPAWIYALAPPSSDGSLLAAGGSLVWRIGPEGATVVAGCDHDCTNDPASAKAAPLEGVAAVADGPDGSFFFADRKRVARVDPSGALTDVAPLGGQSLSRWGDGDLLLAHPDVAPASPEETTAGDDAPVGTVVRIGVDRSTTVVAGGGKAKALAGLSATAIALNPSQVQALPDGFAVFDSAQQVVVMVDGGGRITRVIGVASPAKGAASAVSARGFAVLEDGALVVVRRAEDALIGRVDRLLPGGDWQTVAGGPRTPAPGVPATAVRVLEGVAPLADGSLLVNAVERLVRVDTSGLVAPLPGRRLNADVLAPGLGGALVASYDRIYFVNGSGSLVKLAGSKDAGFFGTSDGEPSANADLQYDPIDLASTPDGGLLIAQAGYGGGGDPARVLWVAPDRTARLALAITRRSLALLAHRRVAIRTTVPARVALVTRRRGHSAGRVAVTVRAGETVVRLPRGLSPGEFTLSARARTSDGQQATSRHRFLLGPVLPMSTARRLTGGQGECRRVSARRVLCIVEDVTEGSMETNYSCSLTSVVLKPSGVIYSRPSSGVEEECTAAVRARVWREKPVWGQIEQAPPL